MIWIILIIIILFVIIFINRDYKENVTNNIINYGGMKTKYAELLDYLSQGAVIDKITKDSVRLRSTNSIWYLDVVGDNIEIQMNSNMPFIGNIKHSWVYPHNYSQTRIIQDLENYISGQLTKMYQEYSNDSINP